MIRLDWIPPQTVKVSQATRPDLAPFVVCGIHVDAGAPGLARAWIVNADGTSGGEILFGNQGGKDDTVAAAILPNGDVRLVVSEAAGPGASGSTAQPAIYLAPGVFAPAPPAGAIDQGARDLANAAAEQANYATTVATTAQSNSTAAVKQANSATNMAHNALSANAAQDEQIAALDTRVQTLEGA